MEISDSPEASTRKEERVKRVTEGSEGEMEAEEKRSRHHSLIENLNFPGPVWRERIVSHKLSYNHHMYTVVHASACSRITYTFHILTHVLHTHTYTQ